MKIMLHGLAGAALASLATVAGAETFLAEAKVVRVEPVVTEHVETECRTAAPVESDLLSLLARDLCLGEFAEVRTHQRPRGYDVYYEWDGHVFSRRMEEHPGETVAVSVSLGL